MTSRRPLALLSILAVLGAWSASAQTAPTAAAKIAAIDLTKPFATRSAWSFSATQGPSIDDPFGMDEDKVPGEIHLCLRQGNGACDPQLDNRMGGSSDDGPFSKPHYIRAAHVVRAASGRPLLFVQVAGLHSGDGNQGVFTQVLAYQRGSDEFKRVYDHVTGTNNNQEVRFMRAGALKGDIISAEPTETAPFGFWITVNASAPDEVYRQVLRYRSATRYDDGNPLSVIDSEMPNIEQRLGLWRYGSPLPIPARSCPRPHLIHMELWCR